MNFVFFRIEQESQQVKEEEQMAQSPSKRPPYEVVVALANLQNEKFNYKKTLFCCFNKWFNIFVFFFHLQYLQYILQDHNYVQPPPRTPPPAPAVSPPHPKQSPVNGSSTVPVPTQIPYMYSQGDNIELQIKLRNFDCKNM